MEIELKLLDSSEMETLIEILAKNGVTVRDANIFCEKGPRRVLYGFRVKIPKEMIKDGKD